MKCQPQCSTPLKSWLFHASIRNCLSCDHNCDDHSSLETICCCPDVPDPFYFKPNALGLQHCSVRQTKITHFDLVLFFWSTSVLLWKTSGFLIFETKKKKKINSIQLTMLYLPSSFKTNSVHLSLGTMTVHAIWQNERCRVFCSDEQSS